MTTRRSGGDARNECAGQWPDRPTKSAKSLARSPCARQLAHVRARRQSRGPGQGARRRVLGDPADAPYRPRARPPPASGEQPGTALIHTCSCGSAAARRRRDACYDVRSQRGRSRRDVCWTAPMLPHRRGGEVVAFYQAAFGARELFEFGISHAAVVARLAIESATFWMADEPPPHQNFSPETLAGATSRLILGLATRRLPGPGRARLARRSCRRSLRAGDRQAARTGCRRVT